MTNKINLNLRFKNSEMAKNWKDIVEKAKEGLKELGDISVNEESPEKEKSEPKKVKNIPPLNE